MSVLIGTGVVAVVAAGYLGRKGWLAFHRAVGIKPGKMVYTPPNKLAPPMMTQLKLNDSQLRYLPPALIDQIIRIDKKADHYQALQNELIQSGRTPTVSEDGFILNKLINTRIPEMLDDYQQIAINEFVPKQDDKDVVRTFAMSATLQQALDLLTQLLDQVENKLDRQTNIQKNNALQNMQAMGQYLQDR